MSRFDSLMAFLVMVAIALAAPGAALVLVSLCLFGQIVLSCLNLSAGFAAPARMGEDRTGASGPIRFSVHVATHEEPPAMVMRTVRALSRQVNAPEFEVIVLDNNTADAALWRPVQALCGRRGPRFRFYHEDGVTGAKAGALNIALERTDPAATHVVVVDADYEVTPDFLSVAAAEIRRTDDDFLQFPQAYRNETRAPGVSLELADYFLRHARQADCAGAMLLTGTLSVIRRSALTAAGGWSGRTITEDAELGLRLRRLGYRGRFVDRVVGRGMLPLDLAGLSLQRYRWAAGNTSTILTGLSGLSPRPALHVAAQLTAWANLALPLTAGLIGGGLALAFGRATVATSLLTSLGGLGLGLIYLSIGLPMILAAATREKPDVATVLAALATRYALILPSATGTVDALLGRVGGFRRTDKDTAATGAGIGPALPALALAGLALLAVPALPPMGVVGAVLLILPCPLALGTRTRLSAYRAALQPA